MTQRLYEDLSLFFAYSVSLELEASERLRELAKAMALHHDHELTELFEELAINSEVHGAKVEGLSEALCIPNMRAWNYVRAEGESPQALDCAEIGFLMSAKDALERALKVEHKAERFYRDIANHAEDQEIKLYATEFAEEERKLVRKVERKIEALASRSNNQPRPGGP
jgi:rubrerythrin